jgi:hypothetical protein
VELRGEGKRVHVDTNGGAVGVVLVGLHFIEVASLANLEPIMSVKLEESGDDRVLAGESLKSGVRETADGDSAIPEVRVVEGLLTVPVINRGVAGDERIALDNPDKLLARVVEVEPDLVGRRGDRLATGELEDLNEVLVGHLGELAALISIKEDVVNIERGSRESLGGNAILHLGGVRPAHVAELVELKVDAHLVVLEGDQGESKARVAAEPELKGDIESVLRSALGPGRSSVRAVSKRSSAVTLAGGIVFALDDVGKLGDVTNHLGVDSLLTGLLGKLIPDVEPVTIMLVNALSTDLKLNGLDEIVARPVQPAELSIRSIGSSRKLNLGESGLEVDAVDKITGALDSAHNLLAEVSGTIEGVLNGLHGKVSVPAVHNLPKSDLGITSQINILSAVSNERHKSTTGHFCFITLLEKIILARRDHFCVCRSSSRFKPQLSLRNNVQRIFPDKTN